MKTVAHILSLIVFFLAVVPCIDDHQNNTGEKLLTIEHTDGSHQNDIDHCSPFCSCQCCPSPILFSFFEFQFSAHYFATNYFSLYSSDFYSTPLGSIW